MYTVSMMNDFKAFSLVLKYGGDILRSKEFRKTKEFIQHGNVSVYTHSVFVAVSCVKVAARYKKVDYKSLVCGALLHDYFLYDWHFRGDRKGLHGFTHAICAYKNAERDFNLNKIVRNMIRSHMCPLNLILPAYRESFILWYCDKACAVKESEKSRCKRIRPSLKMKIKAALKG